MNPLLQQRRAAFSLVEVTLSLGLMAFCLVALLGLLPVGMGATQSASRQSESARLLEQFSSAIGGALRGSDGAYRMIGIGGAADLNWSIGGEVVSSGGEVDGNGDAPGDGFAAALVYRIDLLPPEDGRPASFGRAVVRIAWPSSATFKPGAAWNEGEWEGQSGEMEAFIMFKPE